MTIINGEKLNLNGLIIEIEHPKFSISCPCDKPFAKIRFKRMEKLRKALQNGTKVHISKKLYEKLIPMDSNGNKIEEK